MYRIKKDKRTQRSVEKITQSLTECLNKKMLADVSIAEIADGAGVSRATFYRIFDTPTDVLACLCEIIARELEDSLQQIARDPESDHVLHAIRFLINHADSLKAIFRSGRMDLLEAAIRPRVGTIFPEYLEHIKLNESERDYVKYSIAAVLMSILYVWHEHGCKETATELAKIYKTMRNEQNFIPY